MWLTQAQMAELFQTSKQNVSLHTNNIFKEKELRPDSVVKESLTTATDGKNYLVKYYNLDIIISVGYRVKSIRGTQFRQWANKVLKEYLLKDLGKKMFAFSKLECCPPRRSRPAGSYSRIVNLRHVETLVGNSLKIGRKRRFKITP